MRIQKIEPATDVQPASPAPISGADRPVPDGYVLTPLQLNNTKSLESPSILEHWDVPFTVPFMHRVRFTADCLGDDECVLLDLLEGLPASPARVLACVESSLDVAAQLSWKLRSLAARNGSRLDLLDVLSITGGERIKNDPTALLPVLQAIADQKLDRRNYLLAIGGGAFLDAIGLAAALAHRGIRLIRVPTTTMSQADSGLGVKNGVNFFGQKNWLGSFAVPWAVINDRQMLQTLSDRDWRAGFSEAVKVSLLKEPALFEQICTSAERIARRDWAASAAVLRRSAYWHLNHITAGGDPFEALEARPLDFGHWSAHRLETMTGFALRHGEAVAIGLAIDCAYSCINFGFPAMRQQQLVRCLSDLGLPMYHPALVQSDALLQGLEEFRQHLGGRLTITMLANVGEPIDVHEIDPIAMRRAIELVSAAAAISG